MSEILHRVADDAKTIARDELELARLEVEKSAREAAIDAAIAMLGGVVALIGLGLLCVAAVDALAPLVDPLWLRLLIMAGVFLALGSAVAAAFARRLKRDARPELEPVVEHAERTARGVKRAVRSDAPRSDHA